MSAIVWGIIITLLVIVILWPWFLIPITLAAIYLYILYRDRTNTSKLVPPLWTWGKETNEIIVKKWTTQPQKMILEYRSTEEKKDKKIFTNRHQHQEWNKVTSTFDSSILSKKDAVSVKKNTRHKFRIKGLPPGKKFRYRFVYRPTSGRDQCTQKEGKIIQRPHFEFYTPEPGDEECFFVVCGDSQQSEVLALLESYMWYKIRKENPDFLLYLGDHIHSFQKKRLWFAFFRMMKKILPRIPFYPTVGNHCGGSGKGDQGKTAGFTYLLAPDIEEKHTWNYTWQYKHLYFISVNSLPVLSGDEQKRAQTEQWLKQKIEQAPQSASFTIVYMHVPWIGPPYSQKNIPSEVEKYLENNWKPILDAPEVSLVLSGHKHSYVRKGKYFVSASMHGIRKYKEFDEPGYKVRNKHHYLIIQSNKKRLKVTAKSMGNKILDTFEIEA